MQTDLAKLMLMRRWLELALRAHGVQIEGSGAGLGAADVQVVIDGERYEVSIRSLGKVRSTLEGGKGVGGHDGSGDC